MKLRALKVAEVNQYLKQMMQRDPILNRISVLGELSNFKCHTSGHAYFALKDGDAKINCVWFNAIYDPACKQLIDGMQLICQGAVTLYEKDGKYQLAVKSVELLGIGDLAEQFEKMKRKLEALGYFDPLHKKRLPAYPNKVAIITSPTGSVIRDLLTVSGRRNPNIDVILIPTVVQGQDASASVSDAISRVNDQNLAEVIIIARGGGSIEELWAFNSEEVAHAIFNSAIPVVSAIGHETDFTIADFVADLRAATPSEAAELVFPSLAHSKEQINVLMYKISETMNRKIKNIKLLLSLHNPEREYGKIMSVLDRQKEMTEQCLSRSKRALLQHIQKQQAVLTAQVETLEALSPLKTLTRGYAVISNEGNQTIQSAKQVQVGEILNIRLRDGVIRSEILQVDSTIGETNG
jgi:exodeoxyribonuclease VII large subunit